MPLMRTYKGGKVSVGVGVCVGVSVGATVSETSGATTSTDVAGLVSVGTGAV